MVSLGKTHPGALRGASKLAAGMTLFVGAFSAILGSAHIYGVLMTAGTKAYAYDFRQAALYIVGMTIVAGGVLCIVAVRRLARAQPTGWELALYGTLLILIVSLPLRPIQPELAGGLSAVGILNLVLLGVVLGARFVERRSKATDAAERRPEP